MKPKSQIIKRMDGIDLGKGEKQANAVVVEAADELKFIGSLTETEATGKYRAGYCGNNNQIIAQGMILYKYKGTAPNGAIINEMTTTDMSRVPDIPFYTDVDFSPYSVYYTRDTQGNYFVHDLAGVQFKTRLYSGRNSSGTPIFDGDFDYKTFVEDTGKPTNDVFYYASALKGIAGFAFAWESVFPPDSVYSIADSKTCTFKNGYAVAKLLLMMHEGYYTEESYKIIHYGSYPVPFASMEEYNAAVCLTYEP